MTNISGSTYDCVVIGAGPGGYVAAIRAAQLGLKTACVEREAPGGVCLNWGCIPTKALLKSAEVYNTAKHLADYGVSASDVGYDFAKVVDRSRGVVDKMTKGVSYLLRKNKVDYIAGTASFDSPTSLAVKDSAGQQQQLSFKNAVIATGARARVFPNFPVDGERIMTYRHALSLQSCPQRILIIGAGAIGAEFAYLYNSFGAEVTLVEVLDNILPLEDLEVSQFLKKSFAKSGINVLTNTKVGVLSRKGSVVSAVLEGGGKTADSTVEWTGDYALVAVGMQGNCEGLGLEDIGVSAEKSFIKVNGYYQTSVPHIYAIGDIVGAPLLAHVASHEGLVAVGHLAGQKVHTIDYTSIPACTYCKPQVASIGMTEKLAKERGFSVKIGKFPFSASGRAVASGEAEGFVKVVVESQSEEVLGVHIVHHEASELIGEAAIIRSHEGVAASVFDTIHAHPTLSEGIMEAMGDALGRAVHI